MAAGVFFFSLTPYNRSLYGVKNFTPKRTGIASPLKRENRAGAYTAEPRGFRATPKERPAPLMILFRNPCAADVAADVLSLKPCQDQGGVPLTIGTHHIVTGASLLTVPSLPSLPLPPVAPAFDIVSGGDGAAMIHHPCPSATIPERVPEPLSASFTTLTGLLLSVQVLPLQSLPSLPAVLPDRPQHLTLACRWSRQQVCDPLLRKLGQY